MLPFLSPAWIDALTRAAAAAAAPAVSEEVAVEVIVETGDPAAPGGRVVWHLVAAPSGLSVAPGPHPGALVTLTADVATAAALAQGSANAQRALDQGRLRIRGDLADLAHARAALDALGDVFAAVRADTAFDVVGAPST
jgi:hypothetical protein